MGFKAKPLVEGKPPPPFCFAGPPLSSVLPLRLSMQVEVAGEGTKGAGKQKRSSGGS